MHNSQHHIPFTNDIRDITIGWMGTSVNDSIHIQIQMIKLWQQGRIGDNVIDLGIAFADPAVKLLQVIIRRAGKKSY